MQSHPEDPGTISATQAFSPSARVKFRVAKPTSSSMKESSNQGRTTQEPPTNQPAAASAPQYIWDLKELTKLGSFWQWLKLAYAEMIW